MALRVPRLFITEQNQARLCQTSHTLVPSSYSPWLTTEDRCWPATAVSAAGCQGRPQSHSALLLEEGRGAGSGEAQGTLMPKRADSRHWGGPPSFASYRKSQGGS